MGMQVFGCADVGRLALVYFVGDCGLRIFAVDTCCCCKFYDVVVVVVGGCGLRLFVVDKFVVVVVVVVGQQNNKANKHMKFVEVMRWRWLMTFAIAGSLKALPTTYL